MNSLFHKHAQRSSPLQNWENNTCLIDLNLAGRLVKSKITINRRARRFILKIDPFSRLLIITSPTKRAVSEALAFAKANSAWILKEIDGSICAKPFAPDISFPLYGETVCICNEGGARTRIHLSQNNRLIVGGDPTHINRRVIDWLKKRARQKLTVKADEYSAILGKKRGRLSIRDTRTRWGSCTSDGSLSFSWRLILTPPPIFDYVVAHECSHLVHLDHSRKFWNVVKSLNVDVDFATRWFDKNGAELHAWGVTPSTSEAA